jgi:GNAT superfamily N-acetyltransferase
VKHFLRTASDADVDFITDLTETVMREHIEQMWGQWDPEFQWKDFYRSYPHLRHEIVMCDEGPIGYLAVRNKDEVMFLEKLYLLPAYQNRGVGAALVGGLIDEARAAGKPLQLHIVPVNVGAKRFYERLGFTVAGTAGLFIRMEYASNESQN